MLTVWPWAAVACAASVPAPARAPLVWPSEDELPAVQAHTRARVESRPPDPPPEPAPVAPEPPSGPSFAPAQLAAAGEVAVWHRGEQLAVISRSEAEERGLFMLDVGRDWVPELFRSTPELPNTYERQYIALSNGRFDETNPEGRRALSERYLEPYGIAPSPALLAQRFAALADKPCVGQAPLAPLEGFAGVDWAPDAEPAAPVPEDVVAALQTRLVCEEHLRQTPSGELDEPTHKALAEFERRNRIYARGNLTGETLEALRAPALELERRSLLRVLAERMVLDLGVIEDGSGAGSVPQHVHEPVQDVPDLVQPIRQRVTRALGLDSVQGVRHFYARMAEALQRPHYPIAIEPADIPAYHAPDMDLWVEIDRGDLSYEFPFRADGTPIDFGIERGPTLSLFAREGGVVRPLASYRTTIGGWRVKSYKGRNYWEYKPSPMGTRVWKRVVAAPVWLAPASTPPETLVVQLRRTADGSTFRELNYNLIGPGFGSAFGLVAAYHQRIGHDADGDLKLGDDDGIRTHGSSDYTSIWRLPSNGCHRLHNHLAMRLFNFILAHRAHHRTGHHPVEFRLPVSVAGFSDAFHVTQSGYGFDLDKPVPVRVLRGRVRGERESVIRRRFPIDGTEHPPSPLVEPSGPGPTASGSY